MATFKRFEDIQAWQKLARLHGKFIWLRQPDVFPRTLDCEIKFSVQVFQLWPTWLRVSGATPIANSRIFSTSHIRQYQKYSLICTWR